MKFYSPLRYPGGKGRLAGFMKSVFKENRLCDGTYVEPYAGGAAVALSLLFEEYAGSIVINDVDPLIHAFWHTVLDDTEWLLKKIADTPVEMEMWEHCRRIHKNYSEFDVRDIGFATFFMNRTNRSGIIKAGVIGGKAQKGNYGLDARYNKDDLSKRIKQIALYRSRITLLNLDAVELIVAPLLAANDRTFIYLDPPYYHKGSLLYSNFYTHDDHADIAHHVRGLDIPWVLTYDSVPPIHALYEGENRLDFTLTYSANESRKKGSEVLYYGNIQLPAEYSREKVVHFKRVS